jgi:CRISPR/Cas system-associated endonuclease Cas3-HD
VYEAHQSLQGARLDRVVPYHRLFAAILSTGRQVIDKQIKLRDRIIAVTVFPIEPGRLVGGVIQDVTQPAVAKEQIITKVREVSRRHLTMVQQIASLLGETAAESEVLLKAIIDSFSLAAEENATLGVSAGNTKNHADKDVY